MPQIFNVLKCCSCGMFQVQQKTKARKWSCKVCSVKQSVIKIYGQGTGPECREHVKTCNTVQGQKDEIAHQLLLASDFDPQQTVLHFDQPTGSDEISSKWPQFIEEEQTKTDIIDAEEDYISSWDRCIPSDDPAQKRKKCRQRSYEAISNTGSQVNDVKKRKSHVYIPCDEQQSNKLSGSIPESRIVPTFQPRASCKDNILPSSNTRALVTKEEIHSSGSKWEQFYL
ncbi:PREDICTED: UPF0544 protein C5orf45 homolog [Priapulus caudatus]|uniref:UPF0544 protein C5orf45 homolog n=1 Tax=Priapulus caudatus TaxID=37621 RepID=A0ABM1F4Q4_PRICU|nr:PREDICTED: UPF0544 protein C5orf45 homolog [Priapulus caudatus]